ncbi:MAG: monooxygenase [Myxococcales bacterium]|nr:monooxygenase [Myxococcales bacterium]
MPDKVFIALQNTDDARPLVEAILEDNPSAELNEMPAMLKIDAPGRLVIRRETVCEKSGRDFDLMEIHLNLISLSGNIDESDDEFVLAWHTE